MKAIILFILFIMLTIPTVFGQIKIGDNPQNIDPASVLELESTSKVLVITRVSTLEMEAITPQRGGIVYNIDTECINYYDGTQWVNLCDAVNFTITNGPIINNRATIEITQTASGYNLEIAKNGILGDNIVDGGIGPDDIQDNSITQDKLAAESVGSSEIRQNAVGSDEIRDGSIAPSDIANFIPGQVLVTDENGIVQWGDAGDLMGAVGDEITITGSGTPANPLQITEGIQLNISNNTALIADHIIDDQDTDDTNELVDLTFTKLTNTLSISQSATPVGASVDLSGLVGSDDQQLSLVNNILTLEEGGTPIDLTTYLDNTDEQTLNLAANDDLAISGGNTINLSKYIDNTDEQNLGAATLANEQLTITIDNGNPTTANLSAFATDAAVTTGLALKENLTNKSNNAALGNSNDLYPTQNAVKVYVDNVVGGSAQTIVSTAANNSITPNAIDGGAFYNDLDGNATNEIQNIEQVLAEGNNAGLNPIIGLDVSTDPTSAATRGYVDANLGGTQDLAGVLGNGNSAGNNQINDLLDPTLPQDAATKAYVDANAGISTLTNGFILVGNGANAPAEVAVGGDAQLNNLGELTLNDVVVTPIKIEPSTVNGQFLRTNALGNVVWDNLPTGTPGTVTSDGTTIIGDGLATALQVQLGGITTAQIFDGTIGTADIANNAVTTIKILDDNVTPAKIAQGANGQILTTNGADVVWADPSAGNVNSDATLDGNGNLIPLSLANNAVTTIKILDDNVTPAKIAQGANGQILTTNGADVVWADPTAGNVNSDATLDGNGNLIPLSLANNAVTTIKILDDNVTPAKIEASATTGQILTTNGADVVWADPSAGNVNSDATLDGNGNLIPLSLANNAVTTIKILDDNVTPAKIEASATTGQILTTNGADVVWADPTAGNVNSDATLDGNGNLIPLSLANNAVTTIKILDDNVTPAKIEASATTGQILTTNGADVVWADPSAGNVNSDATLDGNGNLIPLSLANNAVTTIKILDDNVTPAKIEASATTGQILTTNGADVVWADPSAGNVNSDATLDGNGNLIPLSLANNAVTTIKILDDNVTPAKIAQGANGQILTTNGADVVWADPSAGNVNSDATLDGNGNLIPLSLANNAVTTIKILDDNVTPAKIEASATTGQILTTNGADVVWADPTAGNVNSDATLDGNGNLIPLSLANNAVTTIKILDDNVTPAKIEASATTGQILTTNGADVVWQNLTNQANSGSILFSDGFGGITEDINQLFWNNTTLRLGVGIPNPDSKLHVNGQIRASTIANGDGSVNLPSYRFQDDLNSGMWSAGTSLLAFSTASQEAMRIDAGQNIGIGTTAIAANTKLHVVGNSLFEGDVTISAGNTFTPPDYVFESYFDGYSLLDPNYRMLSLLEVEKFTRKNKHLPGISSAKKIQNEGYLITQTVYNHLEKIEELFLHTIEQEKKIKQLESTNKNMASEVEVLKAQMEEIKKLLLEKTKE